jgi:carbon-monoxide dehydrogenase large subunit
MTLQNKFTGRREDHRLVTGHGNYADDRAPAGAAYAAFVRSRIAHAEILTIDIDAAARTPGVLAVFIGKDLRAAGYGDLPCMLSLPPRYGGPPAITPRPALAVERVRYLGEPIVMVVAETMDAAIAAAEAVLVDLEMLPAVTDIRTAAAPGALQIWPHIPDNCVAVYGSGDEAAADAALGAATHRIRMQRPVTRLVVAAMEPRAATAFFEQPSGGWHLHAPSQGVRIMHAALADTVLKGFGDCAIRVTSADVGGGFGAKMEIYPEYVGLLHAARTLRRPVHWRGTRSESFQADNHARDSFYEMELALDRRGQILGLKVAALQSLGAYLSSHGLAVQRSFIECVSSMYAIPAIHVRSRSIITNTTPTGAFRGAGRPEAAYVIESLIEEAARRIGIDAHDLRRLNFVPTTAFPYATPQALVYDCGDFVGITAKAERLADRKGFPSRRAASEQRGLIRGMGTACFIETAGGAPVESARLTVRPNGTISIFTPAQTNGQGHETVFPEMMAQRLGVASEQIELVAGDSDLVPGGPASGSYGSRSGSVFGGALALTTDALLQKGRRLAALRFDVPLDHVTYQGGRFSAQGAGMSCTLAELAAWAMAALNLPVDLRDGLTTQELFTAPSPTFPNGCHICEVEIDPATGRTTVVSYVAVDDCGNIMNPTIVHGQIQGGIAQGIGQALSESCVYDDEGQLVTGSFLDYAMPHADDLPSLQVEDHIVPTKVNPLGVKGAGEAGTTGALAATMNAVADALASRGIAPIDMPASAFRVWQAISSSSNAR